VKILIIPDKFKGSLSATEVCDAVERGLRKAEPNLEIVSMPMADGGEGSLKVVEDYTSADVRKVLVMDPLGRSIEAGYLMDGQKAYIELSTASGLQLLDKGERNPLYTSTYGTGEMILDALSYGATEIYLLVGGSATNDMGIGMAQALGYSFLDRDRDEVPPVGLSLAFIMEIERKLKYDPNQVSFYAICDVDNPLYGKKGAAQVYAPQKGADKYAVEILDKGMRKLSKRCAKYLNKQISKNPGAGAAGGVGGGVLAFLDGQIMSGTDFMLDLVDINLHLSDADIVITGEGKIDKQTLHGKTVAGVARRAKAFNVPLWVVAGASSLTAKDIKTLDIAQLSTIMDKATDITEAMDHAADYLEDIAYAWLNSGS